MADGPQIGTAFLRVTGDFSGVGAQAVGLFKSSKWSNLGKAAGAGLAAGFAVAGVAKIAYEVGQAFDEAYDTIRTTTGATGKELTKLQGDFREVVKSVPTDFDTAAEAVSGLNQRLDLTGKPLRSLSKQMTELSRITGSDITTNVRSVTRLFGDWSVKTGKQEKTLDGLFRLTQQTGIEFSDLADTMVQFGSPMRTLGLDFDFAAAMIAKFEKEGVNMTTLMSGLRLSVANLSDPTDDLSASFEKFGITAKEPAEQVFQVMEAIKQTASVTKGNTLAFEVFGRRAGSDMAAAIREGRFELDDLMATMEGGKETIRGAGRETMDFAEHWQKFKNNVLVGLEPVATRVFEGIGDAMKDITDIISDPKLTKDEKLSKLTDLATDALGDLASAAGRMAPKVAGAFVQGFIKADIWGKLLAGAWISKALLGTVAGKSAYSKLGTTAGSRFGRAFTIGALTLGLAEFGDDIFNWAKGLGEKFKKTGYNIGYDFGSNLAEAYNDTIGAIPGVDNIEIGPNKYEQHEQAQELERSRKREERRGREHVGVMLRQGREFSDAMLGTTRDTTRGTGSLWEGLGGKVEHVGRGMNRDGRRESGKMAEGVVGNFGRMVNKATQGIGRLGDNTNTALKELGAVDKVKFNFAGGSKAWFQRGGLAGIVPGHGSGDTVPLSVGGVPVAKVEPREGVFVGNRNMMAALQGLNDRIPRFAKGGIVGLGHSLQQQGYLVGEHPAFGGVGGMHAPGGYHYTGQALDVNWPSVAQEPAKLDALYSRLKNMPGVVELLWRVADHFDHLHVALSEGAGGALMGGIGNLARLILEGPKGPLRDMGQGALDKTRKAANAFLSKQTVEGIEPGSGGGLAKSQIAQLWSQANNFGNPNLMAAIAMAESSGNPAAHGPPDGRGLYQIEWPIWGSTLGKYGNPYDALANTKMAGQVLKQQGLGAWVVYNTGAYQQFLQKGGMANLGALGLPPYGGVFHNEGTVPGPLGAERTIIAEGGERVSKSAPVVKVIVNGDIVSDNPRADIEDLIEVIVDEKKHEIADYTFREGGRKLGRSRQLAGSGGRA